jgi:hypothetical protein
MSNRGSPLTRLASNAVKMCKSFLAMLAGHGDITTPAFATGPAGGRANTAFRPIKSADADHDVGGPKFGRSNSLNIDDTGGAGSRLGIRIARGRNRGCSPSTGQIHHAGNWRCHFNTVGRSAGAGRSPILR